MIRHALTIVWNRRRQNALLVVEIAASFLVIFAVATIAVYYLRAYAAPLGFERANVWTVVVTSSGGAKRLPDTVRAAVADMPDVETVALADSPPYSYSHWRSEEDREGRTIGFNRDRVSDEFASALGLRVTRGRWFERGDDGAAVAPAVITEHMAREWFGDRDPVGERLGEPDNDAAPRVVGVVTDYRQDGELDAERDYVFTRIDPTSERDSGVPNMVVRLRGPAGPTFERDLAERLARVEPAWSFKIESLETLRGSWLGTQLAPVAVLATLAAFMMMMVALGLSGVLWLSVTRRTSEIGLRRATGATGGAVARHLLLEIFVLTTFGALAGVALAAQPLFFDVLDFVDGTTYALAVLASLGVLYALTLLCGLYPSVLATRVEPAAALHYE